ncbi:MAG: hypothetical protein A4E57_01076 [Syntrophorhabdaceae bacterium PtaU1.Bin034]|nr:MAG: hypothetical protein A4E57_01076 [Syntrophorhabdaceae bacterium PtaU1.Bin034]
MEKKLNAVEVEVARVVRTRHAFVLPLRNAGERAFRWKQRIAGYLRQRPQ